MGSKRESHLNAILTCFYPFTLDKGKEGLYNVIAQGKGLQLHRIR